MDVNYRLPVVYGGRRRLAWASFQEVSRNAKLSPCELRTGRDGLERTYPTGSKISSTHVSVAATCPDYCVFKDHGCFAQSGTDTHTVEHDPAVDEVDGLDVIREEARLIRGAFGDPIRAKGGKSGHGPRDLRLHVGGDVTCVEGAKLLAAAADDWVRRRGGSVWTYTHRWEEIPREAWGSNISVFASVEDPEDIDRAAALGYPSALTVRHFKHGATPFRVEATARRVIPCPEETYRHRVASGLDRGRNPKPTCVTCRLCLDRDILGKMNAVIAFEVHGQDRDAERARRRLPDFPHAPWG